MKHWQAAVLAAAGFLALAGCAPKPTDSAAFEKQAKEDVRRFIPAFNTGDMETVLAQYAPDAEVMAPGNARAVGHDAIRAVLEKESAGLQAAGVALVANDDDKAAASGDIGYHSGSFVVKDAAATLCAPVLRQTIARTVKLNAALENPLLTVRIAKRVVHRKNHCAQTSSLVHGRLLQ